MLDDEKKSGLKRHFCGSTLSQTFVDLGISLLWQSHITQERRAQQVHAISTYGQDESRRKMLRDQPMANGDHLVRDIIDVVPEDACRIHLRPTHEISSRSAC
jgi:hypothetical protein